VPSLQVWRSPSRITPTTFDPALRPSRQFFHRHATGLKSARGYESNKTISCNPQRVRTRRYHQVQIVIEAKPLNATARAPGDPQADKIVSQRKRCQVEAKGPRASGAAPGWASSRAVIGSTRGAG